MQQRNHIGETDEILASGLETARAAVASDPKLCTSREFVLQKLESQVTLKLPLDGETVGQALGSGSTWGANPLCPTQSRK